MPTIRWWTSILLLSSGLVWGQSGQPKSRTPRKSLTPEHATWKQYLETDFAISPERFAALGLTKLTPDQLDSLFIGMYAKQNEIEQKVTNDLEQKKNEKVTYTCATVQPAEPIKVYLSENEKNPSEFSSNFRQRLRGFKDVEIVYNISTADLWVGVLTIENQNKNGSPTGYTTSIVTAQPCESSGFGTKWPMNLVQNHYVLVDSSASDLAESAARDLDANDFEDARKTKSFLKNAQNK